MRRRRATLILIGATLLLSILGSAMPQILVDSQNLIPSVTLPWQQEADKPAVSVEPGTALDGLSKLEVKGRAPKTGYSRDQFGSGWATVNGCSTRDIIMHRDLINITVSDECSVATGLLNDTYTGKPIEFNKENASIIQIDHVVALSDAWQTGAQLITPELRQQLANDPLELIAVSGKENQKKSDANAASWLPPNKPFRCEYIARQIAIKQKYTLWVTPPEHEAMQNILSSCPSQPLPIL
jgi:hypothetical protein